MRGPGPTVPISVFATLRSELYEQMSGSSCHSDVKPPVFSSKSNLVLIYRTMEEMKGSFARPFTARDLNPEPVA
ncbi:hypothetical protein TNCV_3115751 [Trichonephila clavipes]|nr:hypothetical protein TNCV_3115751 [Trichonephila clavipes]